MADLRSWLSRSGLPGTPTAPLKTPQANTWDAEKDTDALFCQHTVEEVRKIAQKIRLDIERKKEDLRQMVGERYRDLIDTADSIVDMKTCSEHVVGSVSTMEQLCQRLQQTHLIRGSGGLQAPPARSEAHSVAAQMKLFTDTPEKIWGCLERREYLGATWLFLLARHTFSHLHQGPPPPSLLHLWHNITTFKDTILECCRHHLQCSGEGEGGTVESLCAIVLLEGCSLRQVFAQFLLARKAAIQAVFSPSRQTHRSVKTQVLEVMEVIQRSLEHTAAIFCQQGHLSLTAGSSLLFKTLKDFVCREWKDHPHLMFPESLATLLPEPTLGFNPPLPTSLAEIPPSDIHSSCEEWVSTCIGDVEQGVGRLLQHVNSIKALANIRDAMHGLLSQQGEGEGVGEVGPMWLEVCAAVIGRKLSLWDTFLRPLLLTRAKAILDHLFSDAEAHGSSLLDQLMQGLEAEPSLYAPDCHVSQYLWQEELHGGGRERTSSLGLKARACTPSVFSFCQSFGEKLEVIIQDASHYLCPPLEDSMQLSSRKSFADPFPFDLYGDSAAMQEFLRQSTTKCISRFLEGVDRRVREMERTMGEGGLHSDLMDRLLVIARVCQSLTSSCSPLSLLSLGCRRLEQGSSAARTPSRSHRLLSHSRQKEAERNSTNEMLYQRANAIYRFWAQRCGMLMGASFQEQLSADMELSTLASSLAWEQVSISEEAESGRQVASIIQVPSQASVYVMSLLFALCQEISRIGGHAVDRSVFVDLSGGVMAAILSAHENLLQEAATNAVPLPQNCALQLLFNVRFLSKVLTLRKDQEEEAGRRLKAISECLQSFVDPFDLDVFLPHLLTNLERQFHRSTVLLGILLALKPPGHLASTSKPPATASTHEKHVVMPLTHTAARFPSLPGGGLQQHTKPLQMSGTVQETSPSLLQTIAFFHHL